MWLSKIGTPLAPFHWFKVHTNLLMALRPLGKTNIREKYGCVRSKKMGSLVRVNI